MIIGTNLLLLRRGLIQANQKRHPALLRTLVVRTRECEIRSRPSSPSPRRATSTARVGISHRDDVYAAHHRTPPPASSAASALVRTVLQASSTTTTTYPRPRDLTTTTSTTTTTTTAARVYRTIPPSLRSAIAADLRSVDHDMDGMIGAEELGTLLRKHGGTFDEGEIVELSELFYSSTGGSRVSISKFLDALDDATTSDGGLEHSLGSDRKLRTHPLGIGTCASEYMFAKSHGKYSEEDLDIEISHRVPSTMSDKTAFFAVKCVRLVFDTATLWNFGSITKEKILNRAIFLETIAAIPGMVAAIIRHFRSLRNMTRDGGMLNMFLEEANNERMHLLTFIRMKEPGMVFRAAVIGAQFGFGGFFLAAYMINPAWCHRFVGYVEEEACHTYTRILREMEDAPRGSELARWKDEDAPKIARGYWALGEDGTVYDVMKAVRADEAEHRDVNHAVSGLPDNAINPLYDPREKMDVMLKKYVEDMMEKEANKHDENRLRA